MDAVDAGSSWAVAGWRWLAPTEGPSPAGACAPLGESGGNASGWSLDHPRRFQAVRAIARATPGWPKGLPWPCLAPGGDGCRRASAGLPYIPEAS